MSLLGEERKEYILNLLDSKGKIRTNKLAKALNVSTETIRRYLEDLENNNKLKRVYGGAVKITFDINEPDYKKRKVINSKEKKLIGKKAAGLINDNEIIAIDEGTTNLEIIKNLMGKNNLKLITSSFPTVNILMEYKNKGLYTGEIFFIGGKVNSNHKRTSGTISERIMDMFYVDKAFISTEGISIDHGITGYDADKGLLSRRIIKNSKQVIVLADFSKIGVRNFYKTCDLEDIDVIISDRKHPDNWKEILKNKNIKWVVVKK